MTAATFRVAIDAGGIATITFDAPGSGVNTMSLAWQHDLASAIEQLEREKPRIAGVILESAKRSFFAGAPLDRFRTLAAADAAASFAEIEAMKASLRRLETLGRPVAAIVAGSALGGGWDAALAAHARFALDDEHLRFGSPEVTLGLIAGTGAIARTVRKLGLLAAQPYLIDGRLFGPREAAELGWVDGIGSSVGELRAQAIDWIRAHPDASQPWDRRDYRMPGGSPDSPKVAVMLATLPAVIALRTRGLYPAPQATLEAMVEGALVDFDAALRIESRKLAKVMVGQVAKNMISAFFFDMKAVRTSAAPALADAKAARDHPLARRLVAAYEREGAAMQDEGIAAALIEHAAIGAGMAAGPNPGKGTGPGEDADPKGGADASEQSAYVAAVDPASFALLKRRLLYAQAIEALRCLRDGVVATRAEANVGSIVGAGFPGWTGGAIQFIASEGSDAFLANAGALAALHGERFAVGADLRQALARTGTTSATGSTERAVSPRPG